MKPFIFTVNLVEPGAVNIPLVSKKDYDVKLPAKEEKSYKISYDLDCDGVAFMKKSKGNYSFNQNISGWNTAEMFGDEYPKEKLPKKKNFPKK